MRGLRWLSLLKAAAVAASILLVRGAAEAQLINGRVIDAGNSANIAGVEIVLMDSLGARVQAQISDVDGVFHLVAPRAGTYWLQATRIGYRTTRTEDLEVAESEGLLVEVRMGVDAVPLEGLNVAVRDQSLRQRDLREFYIRAEQNREVPRGRIFTREDIEAFESWTLGQFVDRVVMNRRCRPAVFLDGSPLLLEGAPLDELTGLLSLANIEGIERYDMFGHPDIRFSNTQSTCGVLLIWSRPLSANGRRFSSKTLAFTAGGFLALTILGKALVF